MANSNNPFPTRQPAGVTMREMPSGKPVPPVAPEQLGRGRVLEQAYQFVDARDAVHYGTETPTHVELYGQYKDLMRHMGPRGQQVWKQAVRWAEDHPRR